jgi:hypothetical protein
MQGPLIASRVLVKGRHGFFLQRVFVWAPPIQQPPLQILPTSVRSFWRIECCACTSSRNPRWPDKGFGAKSSVTRRIQGLKREDCEKSWGIVDPCMGLSHGTAQLGLFVYLREAVTMAARDLSRDSFQGLVRSAGIGLCGSERRGHRSIVGSKCPVPL